MLAYIKWNPKSLKVFQRGKTEETDTAKPRNWLRKEESKKYYSSSSAEFALFLVFCDHH